MTEVWDRLYDAFATLTDPRVERTKHHWSRTIPLRQ